MLGEGEGATDKRGCHILYRVQKAILIFRKKFEDIFKNDKVRTFIFKFFMKWPKCWTMSVIRRAFNLVIMYLEIISSFTISV